MITFNHSHSTPTFKVTVIVFLCFISCFSLVEKHNDNLVDVEAEPMITTPVAIEPKTTLSRIQRGE